VAMENRKIVLSMACFPRLAHLQSNPSFVEISVDKVACELLDSPPSVGSNFVDASLKPCILNSRRTAAESLHDVSGSRCLSDIPLFDRPRRGSSTRQIHLCLIGKT
jgi:hypothetical protein